MWTRTTTTTTITPNNRHSEYQYFYQHSQPKFFVCHFFLLSKYLALALYYTEYSSFIHYCQAQSGKYNKIGLNNRFLTMKAKLRHILATNMKNRRNLLGLSQAKLAEMSNISTGYLAMIEVEKNFPSDDVLERIAHALKIDPTELFSKTCYPVEAVRTLHQSVLEGFDQVVKAQITKFEAKYRG